MTRPDLLALLPLLVLAGMVVVMMIVIAVRRSYRVTAALAMLGLAGALAALPPALAQAPHRLTTLLLIDAYALYYAGLILGAAFVIALYSYGYWARRGGLREEYYLLLLLGTLGAVTLATSTHFASFLLGLEILSVAIYILAAYHRVSGHGIEAGIKYLILAGVSSAFVLFGMALVYSALGTMKLPDLLVLIILERRVDVLMLTGIAMILVGVGFKLALFPFFLWTPDVFEGAPAPVTAFIATVSKAAVAALLLRFFGPLSTSGVASLAPTLAIIAVLTMFAGNLLALLQHNLKRLLAYSSIAHMGYLLVAFLAGGSPAAMVITFYLTAYLVTTLGAFGVIVYLSGGARDIDQLEAYHGLAWRHPWVAGALTVCLLSLAGLPLTAGFMGKFFIVLVGVGAQLWVLVIALILNSAVSLYYYLRVVRTLYRAPEDALAPAAMPVTIRLAGAVLALVVLLLFWLGIYPAPWLALIGRMVGGTP